MPAVHTNVNPSRPARLRRMRSIKLPLCARSRPSSFAGGLLPSGDGAHDRSRVIVIGTYLADLAVPEAEGFRPRHPQRRRPLEQQIEQRDGTIAPGCDLMNIETYDTRGRHDDLEQFLQRSRASIDVPDRQR